MFRGKMKFAFVAGISAALGSVFGKLSGSPDILERLPKLLSDVSTRNQELMVQIFQVVCIGLMIICNASVWSFYVRALQSSNSSLPATVISTATNYIFSAILGILLFGETTGLLWWTGTVFVIIGLALISKSEKCIDGVDKKTE